MFVVSCRRGAPLACLDLPDQVVHYPGRASVSLLAAQAYQLRHFLVRLRRCIQIQRKDGQAVATQRQFDVALEIIQVGDVIFRNAIQFMQEPCILPGHMEGKQVVDIGQHRGPQGALQPIQVGQRLRGEGETAAVLA